MSLIFEVPSANPANAQTHALIIGVGDYPYLRNGTLPTVPVTMGLGQLTSPPVSAAAFANWLIEEYANPIAGLGSIELLLSPGIFQSKTGSVPVDSATMPHIKAAFNAWERRCNANADNVAIFYFCGHGLEREAMLLLAEDFGASPNQLWENSINFSATYTGMGECKAKTQCYFIDSCRETPLDALKANALAATNLKTSFSLAFPPRDAYVYKAAVDGQKAHGPANGVSFFTEGLLACLRNLGADRYDGTSWVVNTSSLSKAIRERMRRTRLPGGQRAYCAVGGESSFTTDITEIPGPALAMVDITCVPSDALGVAELRIEDGTNPPLWRKPLTEPWEIEIPAGSYDFHAHFSAGQYANTSKRLNILPPYFPCPLKVKP